VLPVITLLTDEERARDNRVLACNFAKYSPMLISFTDSVTNKPFLIWLLTPHHTLNMQLHHLVILSLIACFLSLMFRKVLWQYVQGVVEFLITSLLQIYQGIF